MALRNPCNFDIQPPKFTPADRLQALHDVAQAARALRTRNPLVLSEALESLLDAAIKNLDEIESYLGIEHS